MKKAARVLFALIAILCVIFAVSCRTVSVAGGEVVIRFMDSSVRAWGDSTLIEFPDGQRMLIDAGLQKAGAEILQDLKAMGISRIDYLVITHYHNDHVAGLKEILPQIHFDRAWVTGYYPTDFAWVESALAYYGTEIVYVKAGDSFEIGGARIDVLWPTAESVAVRPEGTSKATSGPGSTYDMNCHSMVLKLAYGDNTALFTGDIYVEAEKNLIGLMSGDLSVLDCDILKIMHHGYNTSSSEDFINAVSPKYAFSMGTQVMDNNIYLLYYKVGAEVFMSWQNGRSTVRMNGTCITVETERPGVNSAYTRYVEAWETVQDIRQGQ